MVQYAYFLDNIAIALFQSTLDFSKTTQRNSTSSCAELNVKYIVND